MTQEKKVQVAAEMNVTGVEKSAQDVVQTVRQMASDVAKEGDRASKGLEGMGAGADKADRTVDAATKSISDRLRRLSRDAQREIAAMAATSSGGAGSASATEYEAVMRGANVAKLRPQLDALRELQAQANGLSEAMARAAAGDELIGSLNQRISAFQRQAASAKMAEADLLALKAAELGVTQQAGPLIAKLRESAVAADAQAEATKRAADAGKFLAGLSSQASAIGKTRAELLEMQAAQLGVADKAAPMIAAIRKADGDMAGMGASAKQMQWAMRGLPAQFTDIWVSLASGQNPMTVFIQQGGQIKDMFGGIGPAARALGGYIAGLVNPFTLAAAAAGVLAVAYKAGADEITKLQQASILAGQQLGISAAGLSEVADAAAKLGKSTFGAAAEFIGQVSASSKIAKDDLAQFTATALRMEQVGGPAAKDMAKAIAELGKEPLQASMKLTEQFNYLTASTYNQIKALEEQGRKSEAATLAMRAFFDSMNDRTPQMLASLGLIDRGWLQIKKSISDAWAAMKSFGATNDAAKAIADTEARVDRLRAVVQNNGIASLNEVMKAAQGQSFEAQLAAELRTLGHLKESVKTTEFLAQQEAKRAEVTQLNASWQREGASYLSKQAQAEREIVKAKNEGQRLIAEGLLTEKQLTERIAAIRDKYADKGSKTATIKPIVNPLDTEALKAYSKGLDDFQKISLDAAAGAEHLSKSQAKLRELQASPTWAQYSRQQQEQLIYEASLSQASEDRAAATKAWIASVKEAESEYNKLIGAMGRSADAVEKEVADLEVENRARALSATTGLSLKEAIDKVTIARLEERRVVLAAGGHDGAVEAIDREIEARKRLAVELGKSAWYDAEKKRAEDLAKEYEKLSDTITDALMRGFESGKDFARSLRDTVVNMFKTMVLRPIIQAVVNPIAAGITGVLSGGNAYASAMGGASGIGGLSSIGSTLSNITGALRGLSGNFQTSVLKLGDYLATSQSSIANKIGEFLQANYQIIGSVAGAASGAVAGYGLKQAIGGKFEISSGLSTVQNIGIAVTSLINPALGAVVGAVTGLINRAFGRGPKEIQSQGIVGSFSAGAASGQNFADWKQEGGWFRSDRSGTDFSALTDEMAAALNAGAKATIEQTKAYAKALSLPADILGSISSDFKVKFTEDAEKNKQAIADAIAAYGVTLSTGYARMLTPFQKAGEDMAATLARLGTLQVFSEGLHSLGGVFSRVANLAVDVREEFIAMTGGMESLMGLASQFVQDFYNRDEIAGVKAAELSTALAAVGVDASKIKSKDDYRALVESADLSTGAGREQLAALLQASNAFTTVADYMAETGASLAQVASQAPAGGAITNILNPTGDDLAAMQIDATNSVTDAVNSVKDAISELAAQLKAQQESLLLWSQEVGGGA